MAVGTSREAWWTNPPPNIKIAATAIVEDGAELGEGTVVWHWALVRSGAVLGKNVSVGSKAEIGPACLIGDGCRIGAMAQIHQPAEVGRDVFIGPGAFLGNDRGPMVGKEWEPQPVIVGNEAVIGAQAVVMGGVTIGEGAVAGMGCVVREDVLPGVVVVPGENGHLRVIGQRPKHMEGTEFEHWAPYIPGDVCTWPGCTEIAEVNG